MVPGDGVLAVGPVRSAHLVEGGDTVARLELGHVAADLVHDARHVIALVVNVHPFGHLGGEWRALIREKRVGGGQSFKML